ncbi:hypothetical protein EAH73_07660 [Hymenobacter nivis]|uniref:Uncharacterized protein n=1 Tax=Hymenobacter nivis TaxID=1850093 RepID=A0A502H2K5_9BACT|nr:hypothetical protein EAH73_07660 [Hymenobacter nivis]
MGQHGQGGLLGGQGPHEGQGGQGRQRRGGRHAVHGGVGIVPGQHEQNGGERGHGGRGPKNEAGGQRWGPPGPQASNPRWPGKLSGLATLTDFLLPAPGPGFILRA